MHLGQAVGSVDSLVHVADLRLASFVAASVFASSGNMQQQPDDLFPARPLNPALLYYCYFLSKILPSLLLKLWELKECF